MEVTGPDSIRSVHPLRGKEALQKVALEGDTLAISSEAQKRAEWIEMLKNMPDIRPDKIAAAQNVIESPQVLAAVAHALRTHIL